MPDSALTARGLSGQLRWGYRIVAELGAWTLKDGRVEARPVTCDRFQIEQADTIALHLALGTRTWVWPSVQILEIGDPLTVRVEGSPTLR